MPRDEKVCIFAWLTKSSLLPGRFVDFFIFVAKQEQVVDGPIQLSEPMGFDFLRKGQGLADPLLRLLQTTVQNTSRQTLRPQIGLGIWGLTSRNQLEVGGVTGRNQLDIPEPLIVSLVDGN
jgi:hypothetical protein